MILIEPPVCDFSQEVFAKFKEVQDQMNVARSSAIHISTHHTIDYAAANDASLFIWFVHPQAIGWRLRRKSVGKLTEL